MSDHVREREADAVIRLDDTDQAEVCVHVQAGPETLFGVLARPAGPPNGAAALLLWGKGAAPSLGRNRLPVRLARLVAALGYETLRIDYRGVGESTGDVPAVRLDKPDPLDGVESARWLRERGADRIVLIGTCYGARLCLAVAPHVDELAGVALVPPPLKEFDEERAADYSVAWHVGRSLRPSVMRRLKDPVRRAAYLRRLRGKTRQLLRAPVRTDARPRWIDVNFIDPMQELIERGIPILICNGPDDELRTRMVHPSEKRLRELFERAGDLVTFADVEGTVHGFTTVDVQREVLDAVQRWLSALPPPMARSGPAGIG